MAHMWMPRRIFLPYMTLLSASVPSLPAFLGITNIFLESIPKNAGKDDTNDGKTYRYFDHFFSGIC